VKNGFKILTNLAKAPPVRVISSPLSGIATSDLVDLSFGSYLPLL